MDTQIIAIFCLCDDMLKALHHHHDPQIQMTDAEVMTTAILAALRFGGNFEEARRMLQAEGYIPGMLGKSRFNRRLHRIHDLFLTLFRKTVDENLPGLCQAAVAGDADLVRKGAHLIKGISANIGANRMLTLSGEMEHNARQGDLSTIENQAGQLVREYEQFKEVVAMHK